MLDKYMPIIFPVLLLLLYLFSKDSAPLFKKGDIIVPEDAEHWEDNLALVIDEVGKYKYRLSSFAEPSSKFLTLHRQEIEAFYKIKDHT